MNMYGPINPEDFLVAFLNVSSRLDGSKDIERVFMEWCRAFRNDDGEVLNVAATVEKNMRLILRSLALTEAYKNFPDRFDAYLQMAGGTPTVQSYLLMAAAICPFATHADYQSSFDVDKLLALADKFRDGYEFYEPKKMGKREAE
jgi:hypothetical protein